MDNELVFRLKRIYSAIGETVSTDIAGIKQRTVQSGSTTSYVIDFNGLYTEEQLSNFAHMAISNVAALSDHIRKWLRRNKKNESEFNRLMNLSANIGAIEDLNNNDKHGYPPRDGGHTKKSIKLKSISRQLRISAALPGVASPPSPEGCPITIGQGRGQLIITGPIVDVDNKPYGDLHDCLLAALSEYEKIFAVYSSLAPAEGGDCGGAGNSVTLV